MFDLRRIPIVRVLLPFAGGSLAGCGILPTVRMPDLLLLSPQVCLLFAMAGIWILLLTTFYWRGWKPGIMEVLFSLLTFMCFFVSGFLSCIVSRPQDPGLPIEEKVMIRGEITEGPTPGSNNWSYGMDIRMLCCKDSAFALRTHLKVYLAVPAISINDSIMPRAGETWQLYGLLVPIKNSGNPGTPDFKAIMGRKNCWYRFYSDACFRQFKGDQRISSAHIRNAVSSHWKGNDSEISLLKALCLGDRSDLTDDMKEAYSNAGAMHLLAVSGLHLGLIWWVLYHLFFWMVRISGKEFYRSVTIISLLWVFAFVSGFSSSVSRSATMFSLFTAGRLMDQRMQSLNGILVSAFLLILIHPPVILNVGFQLSYAAILGIVSFYPAFRSLLHTKNRLLRWVWDACLLSLSAQLTTAPLVIYYFHQIPVYSLITSLLTIPLLSVLISIFVISVPFILTGVLGAFFNELLMKMAFFINQSVGLMASIPGAVIPDLKLNTFSLCLWMGILFMLMLMLNQRSVLPRYLLLAGLSISLCWASMTSYHTLHSSALVISHFNKASLLTFREGDRVDHYYWYSDSTSYSYMKRYMSETWSKRKFQTRMMDLRKPLAEKGSISACQQVAPGVWLLGNDQCKGWFVSGSADLKRAGLHHKQPELYGHFRDDFVLLSDNPPTWSIAGLLFSGPGELVLDGSNRSWYSGQLDRFKTENQLQFDEYRTYEHGAYLKRW